MTLTRGRDYNNDGLRNTIHGRLARKHEVSWPLLKEDEHGIRQRIPGLHDPLSCFFLTSMPNAIPTIEMNSPMGSLAKSGHITLFSVMLSAGSLCQVLYFIFLNRLLLLKGGKWADEYG